ncbi:hypothetical protein BVG98_07710 [Lacticaseibacillus rhamnosus]|nr:hypothetical protein BVG98_07710 [Lacticaseibacillus rhamnosus]
MYLRNFWYVSAEFLVCICSESLGRVRPEILYSIDSIDSIEIKTHAKPWGETLPKPHTNPWSLRSLKRCGFATFNSGSACAPLACPSALRLRGSGKTSATASESVRKSSLRTVRASQTPIFAF